MALGSSSMTPMTAGSKGGHNQSFAKRVFLASTVAVAVLCLGVLVVERDDDLMGSALGISYYAVTKPPAFNFNRFIENVWIYDGRSASRDEEGFIEKLARRHHYKLQIHHLNTFKDNEFRAALFSQDIHCIIFPPLSHFPGIGELAKKDLRGYVSAGNNIVFVGSYEWLSIMNDVFGFQLMSDYKDGPYYRNDRNVRGTPFQWSMSRLEQPDGSIYSVKVDSIPMEGACMFDTMGACVVFFTKYNLGTIVYIAFAYDTPYGIGHWDQILHAAMMM
mmetsp:Transcript_22027/g.60335  ORF Transcript_22027/g.60335 Transcript_22027/m.60335 type:complete len:275 (-) Transcript_22027:120-944(-)